MEVNTSLGLPTLPYTPPKPLNGYAVLCGFQRYHLVVSVWYAREGHSHYKSSSFWIFLLASLQKPCSGIWQIWLRKGCFQNHLARSHILQSEATLCLTLIVRCLNHNLIAHGCNSRGIISGLVTAISMRTRTIGREPCNICFEEDY